MAGIESYAVYLPTPRLDRGQIAQLLRENMGSASGSIRLSLQKKSY